MRVTAGRAVKDRNKWQQEKYPEERGRSGRNKRRRDKHQKSVCLTVGYMGETWELVCYLWYMGMTWGWESSWWSGLGFCKSFGFNFLFLPPLPKLPGPSLLQAVGFFSLFVFLFVCFYPVEMAGF